MYLTFFADFDFRLSSRITYLLSFMSQSTCICRGDYGLKSLCNPLSLNHVLEIPDKIVNVLSFMSFRTKQKARQVMKTVCMSSSPAGLLYRIRMVLRAGVLLFILFYLYTHCALTLMALFDQSQIPIGFFLGHHVFDLNLISCQPVCNPSSTHRTADSYHFSASNHLQTSSVSGCTFRKRSGLYGLWL